MERRRKAAGKIINSWNTKEAVGMVESEILEGWCNNGDEVVVAVPHWTSRAVGVIIVVLVAETFRD